MKTFKKIFVFLAITLLLFSYSSMETKAAVGILEQIPYTGSLKTVAGDNAVDGNYAMVFNLYTVSTGGAAVWTETHNTVSLSNGIFSLMLGDTSSLAGFDFNADSYYLGISVNGGAEMSPRQRIGASAYAFNADKVDGASAGTAANEVLKLGSSGQISISSYVEGVSYLSLSPGAAPGTPADGQLYYSTADSTMYARINGSWVDLDSSGGATNSISQGNSAVTVTDAGADGTIILNTEGVDHLTLSSAGLFSMAGVTGNDLLNFNPGTDATSYFGATDQDNAFIFRSSGGNLLSINGMDGEAIFTADAIFNGAFTVNSEFNVSEGLTVAGESYTLGAENVNSVGGSYTVTTINNAFAAVEVGNDFKVGGQDFFVTSKVNDNEITINKSSPNWVGQPFSYAEAVFQVFDDVGNLSFSLGESGYMNNDITMASGTSIIGKGDEFAIKALQGAFYITDPSTFNFHKSETVLDTTTRMFEVNGEENYIRIGSGDLAMKTEYYGATGNPFWDINPAPDASSYFGATDQDNAFVFRGSGAAGTNDFLKIVTMDGEIVIDNSSLLMKGVTGNDLLNFNPGTDASSYFGATDQDNAFIFRGSGGTLFSINAMDDEVTSSAAQTNVTGELSVASVNDGVGSVVCVKADGNLGTCTDAPDGSGNCTCN